MRDYDSAVTSFNYRQLAAQDLHGELAAMNACIECCDRHALGDAVAFTAKRRMAAPRTTRSANCRPTLRASATFCASKGSSRESV